MQRTGPWTPTSRVPHAAGRRERAWCGRQVSSEAHGRPGGQNHIQGAEGGTSRARPVPGASQTPSPGLGWQGPRQVNGLVRCAKKGGSERPGPHKRLPTFRSAQKRARDESAGCAKAPLPAGSAALRRLPRGHGGPALGKLWPSWHWLRAPVLWEVATRAPTGLSRRPVPGGRHTGPSGDRGFSVPHADGFWGLILQPGPGGAGEDSTVLFHELPGEWHVLSRPGPPARLKIRCSVPRAFLKNEPDVAFP